MFNYLGVWWQKVGQGGGVGRQWVQVPTRAIRANHESEKYPHKPQITPKIHHTMETIVNNFTSVTSPQLYSSLSTGLYTFHRGLSEIF